MRTATLRTFEEAFPELFRVAYRAAYRVTGDVAVSEDVASEALTRAGVRWRRIGDRALPWVVRVATNLAIDHARRRAREARAVDDGRRARTEGIDSVHTRVDLHRALKALPRRQQEVVVLRYFGDLTEREIATELGLAPGTVKSHASRGLAALRARLDDRPATAAGTDADADPLLPEELS